jgi:protein O-GlcNAc transferase
VRRGGRGVGLLAGMGILGAAMASASAAVPTGACAGAEAALGSAAKALDKGEWAEAERRLEPLSASHPDCGRVVLGQARLRAARKDDVDAERLFARATTLDPADALAHAQFAQYWLSRGQNARADHLSSVALSLNPDNPDALVVQARLASLRGRLPAARGALEKAVRLDPAHAEARYQLGVWLFRRQLHPDAVAQFERVIALRPLDARAYDYLALGLEGLGEAERAEAAYRAALAVNDGPFADVLLDYNYGRFLLKLGRLEESRPHLDKAVALLPQRRGPHYERARLNLALEQYAAARADAERALSLRDPAGLVLDLQVYYLLATVYSRLGESDLARKYAELSRTTPIPDQAADRPR